MITIRSKLVVFLILLLVLPACGPGTPDSPTDVPPTEEPTADLLVVDSEILDPEATYTFENPGGWMFYQGHLSTTDRTVDIYTLPSPQSAGTFEDYIKSWTDQPLEITETDKGLTYAVGTIGDTISVLLETPDGVRWGIQMALTDTAPADTDLEDYRDDLMTIALSATYIPRETEEDGD